MEDGELRMEDRADILDPPSSVFDPLSTQLSATLAFAASLRMCFSNHAIR